MVTRLKFTLDGAREKDKMSSNFIKHYAAFYNTSFYLKKDINDEDNGCEAEQMVSLRKWIQVAMFGMKVSTGYIRPKERHHEFLELSRLKPAPGHCTVPQ